MTKSIKILLIVAASLILAGIIVLGGVMTVLDWDFTKLTTAKFVTAEHELNAEYENIIINTKTANVELVPSETANTKVVCSEYVNTSHTVSVEDGTLVIEARDSRKWYEYIGINFKSPKITVYLPVAEYTSLFVKTSTGKVEIPKGLRFESIEVSGNTGSITCFASVSGMAELKTSTGNINVENISAGALHLEVSTGTVNVTDVKCEGTVSVEVSTGKVYLTDVKCGSLISEGDTGYIFLSNVTAEKKFTIERDTGNVKFDRCDAGMLFIETDTGNITGTLLSEKIFIVKSDTGKVNVPKTATGGRCEISSDTGNIIIEIVR